MRRPAGPGLEGAALCEALTVAMAVGPGVYSRNLHFDLHERPEVRAARRRAAVLRGILARLAQATEVTLEEDPASGACELRYRVPALAFARRATLSRVEAACLRFLASEAGLPAITAREGDRGEVERAIARLGP